MCVAPLGLRQWEAGSSCGASVPKELRLALDAVPVVAVPIATASVVLGLSADDVVGSVVNVPCSPRRAPEGRVDGFGSGGDGAWRTVVGIASGAGGEACECVWFACVVKEVKKCLERFRLCKLGGERFVQGEGHEYAGSELLQQWLSSAPTAMAEWGRRVRTTKSNCSLLFHDSLTERAQASDV